LSLILLLATAVIVEVTPYQQFLSGSRGIRAVYPKEMVIAHHATVRSYLNQVPPVLYGRDGGMIDSSFFDKMKYLHTFSFVSLGTEGSVRIVSI